MESEPSVLIVDDEKHTREGLRRTLEDSFDVYIAGNRDEAMEVLRSEGIDVMVTDLRLGGEDGMELIEEARTLSKPPICIMMTAYGSVDTAVEAMKRGAYHFVTKPLNIDELEMLIKRALRGRDLEKENRALKKQVENRFLGGKHPRKVERDSERCWKRSNRLRRRGRPFSSRGRAGLERSSWRMPSTT